jgi:peptide chain release factor 1
LHLSRSSDDESILLRELIHTEDRDDILEFFIPLEDLLTGTSGVIVVISYGGWCEDGRCRVERIDCRIDAQFCDRAREYHSRIEVSEGIRWSGIGEVISGDVDGLYGCDRSIAGRGDTLLESTHISRESRLVSDR